MCYISYMNCSNLNEWFPVVDERVIEITRHHAVFAMMAANFFTRWFICICLTTPRILYKRADKRSAAGLLGYFSGGHLNPGER
jgi:hypothetical protein